MKGDQLPETDALLFPGAMQDQIFTALVAIRLKMYIKGDWVYY